MKKMLGCLNPCLGQIWANPTLGLNFKTQWLGLSIFDPNMGLNNPLFFFFRVSSYHGTPFLALTS